VAKPSWGAVSCCLSKENEKLSRAFSPSINRAWWGRGIIILSLIAFIVACSLQGEDTGEPFTATEITPGESESGPLSTGITRNRDVAKQSDLHCSELQYPLVDDFEIQRVPNLDEPPARSPFRDPIFGTCLIRVTDRAVDFNLGAPDEGLKNEYSREKSFNADGSLIIVFSTTGDWYIYDGVTLSPLGQIPVNVEPRWDAEDPDLIYFIDESRLMSYRISTGLTSLVHEFANDFPGQEIMAAWTRYEGSPSKDSRYWGLMVEDKDWRPISLLIYDLEIDQVIARREANPDWDIDSVSISPLGNYFLAFHDDYCESGQLGDEIHPCGLMVYDRQLENGRGLLRIIGHSDLALDADSKEVLVFQDIDTDYISMLNLEDGEITTLWLIDFSNSALGFHFSGNSYQLPGWVLVSTHNGAQPSATWMDDQIFALELKQGGRVVRFAHTHSTVDQHQEQDYWAEPHASVNQDFTRILFTSNWGRSGSAEVDMYLLELPQDWIEHLNDE
jgi:hypothetical protein